MKRMFDVVTSIMCLVLFSVPMMIIAVVIKLTSPGPVLFWSKRIGRENSVFLMPKFRTMISGSPLVATHLLRDPESFITPVGRFLRKLSLDELPQVWCILKGQMSFVGPRPALFNQDDLIFLRTQRGIHVLLPGLTGWAQINGRDEIPIYKKVELETEYLARRGMSFDLYIIVKTAINVLAGRDVSH